MLKTIDRYVIREIVPPFLLALLIFTFILALPPIMEQLERLVAKGVPWQTAGYIIVLLMPQALGLTIPMALLVGLLIGLGRMSADRESVALLACGVSPYRLLRPVMAIALVAAAATMYVMIEAIPDANQRYREVVFQILTNRVEGEIRPRVFYDDFPQYTLYPQDEAGPGESGWRNLLVANTSRSDSIEVFMARKGRIVLDPDEADGSARHDGRLAILHRQAGRVQYAPVHRAADHQPRSEHRLPGRRHRARRDREDHRPAAARTSTPSARDGESPHNEIMAIHTKFSIPVACLVFALIALALGMTVSRDGKLGGFVVGIGVIFAYYIAMFVAESAAKGHSIPAEWARWIPNLLLGPFGVVALILRARHAEGRLPFGLKLSLPAMPAWLRRRVATSDSPAAPARPRDRRRLPGRKAS